MNVLANKVFLRDKTGINHLESIRQFAAILNMPNGEFDYVMRDGKAYSKLTQSKLNLTIYFSRETLAHHHFKGYRSKSTK